MKKKSPLIIILICVIICLSLGSLSGINNKDAIVNWYQYINKPSWTLSDWLFGPVWTLLYILMGISVALVLHSDNANKKFAVSVFIFQFVFNLAWSFIFFSQQATGWAFMEIIILLILIIVTTNSFYKVNKLSALLLFPYLIWVLFASVLNGTIWYLNK